MTGLNANISTLKNSSAKPYARVHQGVGYISQDKTDDIQYRPQEHHGTHDGKVLAADGVDHIASQAGYAEERLGNQTAHEQERQRCYHASQYGDQGVPQNMPEEHGQLRQAFGTGATHIVFAHLLEKYGAVPAYTRSQAGNNAYRHRQYDELYGVDTPV